MLNTTNVCIFEGVLKKLLSILILLVYVPAIAGVGFSTHYCAGEARETKVFSVSKQSCCCGEAEAESNGCCSDKITVIKLDKDQQGSQQISIQPLVVDVLLAFEIPVFMQVFYQSQNTFVDTSPPDIPLPEKAVAYCCFLI